MVTLPLLFLAKCGRIRRFMVNLEDPSPIELNVRLKNRTELFVKGRLYDWAGPNTNDNDVMNCLKFSEAYLQTKDGRLGSGIVFV